MRRDGEESKRSATIFVLGIGAGFGTAFGLLIGSSANLALPTEGFGSVGDWTGALSAALTALLSLKIARDANAREREARESIANGAVFRILPAWNTCSSILRAVTKATQEVDGVGMSEVITDSLRALANLSFDHALIDKIRLDCVHPDLSLAASEFAALCEMKRRAAASRLAEYKQNSTNKSQNGGARMYYVPRDRRVGELDWIRQTSEILEKSSEDVRKAIDHHVI